MLKMSNPVLFTMVLTIVASAPLEAEIPRFSDKNQKNSKNAQNLNVKWLVIIGNN